MSAGARSGIAMLSAGVLLTAAVQGAALFGGAVPPWGAWTMLAGTVLLFAGTLALGRRRTGSASWIGRLAVVTTALLVGVPFALALLLPAEGADAALWAGLPRRAAIVIYGVGLLPALILPLLYALEHREDPVDALRARLAAARDAAAP